MSIIMGMDLEDVASEMHQSRQSERRSIKIIQKPIESSPKNELLTSKT